MTRRTRILRLTLAAVLLIGIGATYAAVEDTTNTANNRITTDDIPNQVDLVITPHDYTVTQNTNCNNVPAGDFVQNQDQGAAAELLIIEDANPGDSVRTFVCLKNAGTNPARLDLATVFDVTDIDIACTGNEASTDLTCGGNGAGELASEAILDIGVNNNVGGTNNNCDNGPGRRFLFGDPAGSPAGQAMIAEGAAVPSSTTINNLAPGATICLTMDLTYSNNNTTIAEANENQSDELKFKVRFRATEQ